MSEIWITEHDWIPADPCVICVALAKQEIINQNAEKVAAAAEDGKRERTWISGVQPTSPVFMAVVHAVSLVYPMFGTIGMCLTHAPAIQTDPEEVRKIQQQQRQEALRQAAMNPLGAMPLPPGLFKGDGRG